MKVNSKHPIHLDRMPVWRKLAQCRTTHGTGHLRNFYFKKISPNFSLSYLISIVYSLDTHRMHIRPHWIHLGYTTYTYIHIHIGYTLDTHWIHIQYPLDTHWINIRYTLDAHWIHIGYTLNKLWIHRWYTLNTSQIELYWVKMGSQPIYSHNPNYN